MKNNWYKVGALLILFLVLGITSMAGKGITNDEATHIPSGYSYWKTFDYRLNIEHPPLIKLIAALPLLVLNPTLPLDDSSWEEPLQWDFGTRFLYLSNQNADQIVFWSRIPMMLLAAFFGIFVFLFARDLYGEHAGLLALFLYALSPTILAHARLVTTDLGISGFTLMSLYFLWRYVKKKKKKDLLLTGISVGCALSAKYTGIFIPGILAAVLLCYLLVEHKGKVMQVVKSKETFTLAKAFVIILLIGGSILVVSYGITEAPTYLEGFGAVVFHSSTGHRAFLMGEYSETGWWYYFPIAFLLKTPLGILGLLFLSIISLRWYKPRKDELFLLIPLLCFFVLFMMNKINIGVRHILPVYPLLFIYMSRLTKVNWKKAVKVALIGALLVLFVIESMMIYPHYLAFFNEAAGGPEQGWQHLIDSNIDWGQDLKGLGEWMNENNIEHIKLTYFGTDSKLYRGISWKEMTCGPSTGLMAVSVTRLIGFTERSGICLHWLREQTPIANIGHSILIYNISTEDIIGGKDAYCGLICKDKCAKENQEYVESVYNKTCKCRCTRRS